MVPQEPTVVVLQHGFRLYTEVQRRDRRRGSDRDTGGTEQRREPKQAEKESREEHRKKAGATQEEEPTAERNPTVWRTPLSVIRLAPMAMRLSPIGPSAFLSDEPSSAPRGDKSPPAVRRADHAFRFVSRVPT
jgi:hypothetical protein